MNLTRREFKNAALSSALRPPCGVRERRVWNKFLQEPLHWRNKYSVDERLLPSPAEKKRPAFRIVVMECFETREIPGSDSGRVLHLDGDEFLRRIDDEIDFGSCSRPPKVESVAFSGIVEPCAEMLMHKTLERHAVYFLRPVQRPLGAKSAKYARVEEVKLRMCDCFPFRPFGEDRQARGDEHFVEYLEIGIDRGAFDSGLARNGACGKNAAVGECCGFEEARENIEVANDSFRDDFFLKVKVEIRSEDVLRFLGVRVAHKRNHAEFERVREPEITPHLGSEERVALALYGPPTEEIGIRCALEFARAGTSEDEPKVAPFFDEIVYSVEQGRNALYFVNDECHFVGVCTDDVFQAFGVRSQTAPRVRFKKVDRVCLWELLGKPHRLAGAARAKKEETARREAYRSKFHAAYLTKYGGARQWQFSVADGKNALNFPSAMENLKEAA